MVVATSSVSVGITQTDDYGVIPSLGALFHDRDSRMCNSSYPSLEYGDRVAVNNRIREFGRKCQSLRKCQLRVNESDYMERTTSYTFGWNTLRKDVITSSESAVRTSRQVTAVIPTHTRPIVDWCYR